eukprot:4476257-Alexandrium_andersonii.AAC.1
MFPGEPTRWTSNRSIDWGLLKWRGCRVEVRVGNELVVSDHKLVSFRIQGASSHMEAPSTGWCWPRSVKLPGNDDERE